MAPERRVRSRKADDYEQQLKRQELAASRALMQVLPTDRPANGRELQAAERALARALFGLQRLARDLDYDVEQLRGRQHPPAQPARRAPDELYRLEAAGNAIQEVVERWEGRRAQLGEAADRRGGRRPAGGPPRGGRDQDGERRRSGQPGSGGRRQPPASTDRRSGAASTDRRGTPGATERRGASGSGGRQGPSGAPAERRGASGSGGRRNASAAGGRRGTSAGGERRGSPGAADRRGTAGAAPGKRRNTPAGRGGRDRGGSG